MRPHRFSNGHGAAPAAAALVPGSELWNVALDTVGLRDTADGAKVLNIGSPEELGKLVRAILARTFAPAA